MVNRELARERNEVLLYDAESTTMQERELALELRSLAATLFEDHGVESEVLPEDEGELHKVRGLDLSDDSSTLADIGVSEYSDGSLKFFVAFECDEYIDEDGDIVPGRMIISAGIDVHNKLTSGSTTIVGEHNGTHLKNKFNRKRDDPTVRLEQIIGVLETEVAAYDTSISMGIEPIHGNTDYFSEDQSELYFQCALEGIGVLLDPIDDR
jgi:hypothetical protein